MKDKSLLLTRRWRTIKSLKDIFRCNKGLVGRPVKYHTHLCWEQNPELGNDTLTHPWIPHRAGCTYQRSTWWLRISRNITALRLECSSGEGNTKFSVFLIWLSYSLSKLFVACTFFSNLWGEPHQREAKAKQVCTVGTGRRERETVPWGMN